MSEYFGCGDSLCVFGAPDGQRTNGGCRCLFRPDPSTRRRVEAGIRQLTAERDALKEQNAKVFTQMVIEHDKIRVERDALKAELQQIHDYHKSVMSEECSLDEKHCTCVPALRAEWERAVSLYEREAMQNVKYREALEKIQHLCRYKTQDGGIRTMSTLNEISGLAGQALEGEK